MLGALINDSVAKSYQEIIIFWVFFLPGISPTKKKTHPNWKSFNCQEITWNLIKHTASCIKTEGKKVFKESRQLEAKQEFADMLSAMSRG